MILTHREFEKEMSKRLLACPFCEGDVKIACRIVSKREVLADFKPITRAIQYLEYVGLLPKTARRTKSGRPNDQQSIEAGVAPCL